MLDLQSIVYRLNHICMFIALETPSSHHFLNLLCNANHNYMQIKWGQKYGLDRFEVQLRNEKM